MKPDQTLLCFAHGGSAGWEAICVDFDLAVQGGSFLEAQELLSGAIAAYVESAMDEDEATRRKLLARRAPFLTRLTLTLRLLAFNIFHGRQREAQASFPLLCPA